MKVFIAETKKDGEKFEGPRINALSWREAESVTAHIEGVILIGELG